MELELGEAAVVIVVVSCPPEGCNSATESNRMKKYMRLFLFMY